MLLPLGFQFGEFRLLFRGGGTRGRLLLLHQCLLLR